VKVQAKEVETEKPDSSQPTPDSSQLAPDSSQPTPDTSRTDPDKKTEPEESFDVVDPKTGEQKPVEQVVKPRRTKQEIAKEERDKFWQEKYDKEMADFESNIKGEKLPVKMVAISLQALNKQAR